MWGASACPRNLKNKTCTHYVFGAAAAWRRSRGGGVVVDSSFDAIDTWNTPSRLPEVPRRSRPTPRSASSAYKRAPTFRIHHSRPPMPNGAPMMQEQVCKRAIATESKSIGHSKRRPSSRCPCWTARRSCTSTSGARSSEGSTASTCWVEPIAGGESLRKKYNTTTVELEFFHVLLRGLGGR